MGSFGKKVFLRWGWVGQGGGDKGWRTVCCGWRGRQPRHARARARPETEVHGFVTGGWAGRMSGCKYLFDWEHNDCSGRLPSLRPGRPLHPGLNWPSTSWHKPDAFCVGGSNCQLLTTGLTIARFFLNAKNYDKKIRSLTADSRRLTQMGIGKSEDGKTPNAERRIIGRTRLAQSRSQPGNRRSELASTPTY